MIFSSRHALFHLPLVSLIQVGLWVSVCQSHSSQLWSLFIRIENVKCEFRGVKEPMSPMLNLPYYVIRSVFSTHRKCYVHTIEWKSALNNSLKEIICICTNKFYSLNMNTHTRKKNIILLMHVSLVFGCSRFCYFEYVWQSFWNYVDVGERDHVEFDTVKLWPACSAL